LYPKKVFHLPSEKFCAATSLKSPEKIDEELLINNDITDTIIKKGINTFKKFVQKSGCFILVNKLIYFNFLLL
jgi:hypothetical protein